MAWARRRSRYFSRSPRSFCSPILLPMSPRASSKERSFASRSRLELQDLISPLSAYRLRDIANLHLAREDPGGSSPILRYFSGPMRPPFALDAAEEYSPASRGNGSPGQQPFPDLLRLFTNRVVFRHIHAAIGRLDFQENFPERHLGRRREFLPMRVVEGSGFFVGDADLLEDLRALDLLHQHLSLEIPPQIGHRQPFLLERLLKLRLVLEVVRRLDVFKNLSELLIAERETRLSPPLNQQEFVDGRENQIGSDFGDGLLQFRTRRGRVRQLGAISELRHLTGFEFRLCDDFAVHLDQDLLQDLGVDSWGNGQRRQEPLWSQ